MDQIDEIFEEHGKLRKTIRDIYDDMLEMYQTLDGDQQRVFDMGEVFGTAKEALRWSEHGDAGASAEEEKETNEPDEI